MALSEGAVEEAGGAPAEGVAGGAAEGAAEDAAEGAAELKQRIAPPKLWAHQDVCTK